MMIHHDIDKVFKKGLKDYSVRPPGFVWDNIQQQLDNKKIKKRKSLIYSMAATVALLLSFGAGYVFHFISPINNEELAQQSLQKYEVLPNTQYEKILDVINNNLVDSNLINQEYNSNKKLETSESGYVLKDTDIDRSQKISLEDEIDDAVEEYIDNDIQVERDENSLIKKVKSSGVLLPPSFADSSKSFEDYSNEYDSDNNESLTIVQENDVELETKGTPFSAEYKNQIKNVNSEVLLKDELNLDDGDESVWGIGVSATPLLSYRNIKSVPDAGSQMLVTNDYDKEQPLVAYAGGIDVNYSVASKWKLHSGVYVSKIGQVSENIDMNANELYAAQKGIVDGYSVSTSAGNVNVGKVVESFTSVLENAVNTPSFIPSYEGEAAPVTLVSADMVQTFSYVEIPFVVSYSIIDNKIGVNLSGGMSANLLYNNSIYLESNGDKHAIESDIVGINKVNYNGVIGVGINYPIVERLKVSIQPTFRYSLTPINGAGEVYPYSFGIFSGVQYQF